MSECVYHRRYINNDVKHVVQAGEQWRLCDLFTFPRLPLFSKWFAFRVISFCIQCNIVFVFRSWQVSCSELMVHGNHNTADFHLDLSGHTLA